MKKWTHEEADGVRKEIVKIAREIFNGMNAAESVLLASELLVLESRTECAEHKKKIAMLEQELKEHREKCLRRTRASMHN